jgi:hypothetical protein
LTFCLYKDRALIWHNIWTENGRPREGIVAQIRRSSRAIYHRAIRKLVKEENIITRAKTADGLISNDNRNFWSEIRKIKGRSRNIPNVIDKCNNPHDIAQLFFKSYQQLFSSVTSNDAEIELMRNMVNAKIKYGVESFIVTAVDIDNAVQRPKHGKHCHDRIY